MTQKSGSTTLKQVADIAGVSITAASKVLHGSKSNVRVSEKTALHIQSVARDLRYVPNGVARSLRTRRSDTIGLVFENIGHLADGSLFNSLMLDSIGAEVFKRHYRLTILSEIDYAKEIETLGDGRLDGLVWCKLPADPGILGRIENLNIPCVALCSPPPHAMHQVNFFCCDNEGGAQLAVKEMALRGHQRILFVLEEGEALTPDALARLKGCRLACQDHGIQFSEDDTVIWRYDASNFVEWWQGKPPHTAIFAWNEGVAGNILGQALAVGVRVPEELSVVGFDSTQYCETTSPKLTAVKQPISQIAKAAAQRLFNFLEGNKEDRGDEMFECSIDIRESLSSAPNRG